MGILVFLFLKLFFFWAILTIFEVAVIYSMEVSTFKYLKLLKFLEFFYVILTIISIVFYLYINVEIFSYFYYSLSIMIYFGILIYDFWKKKITKKDYIIYFLYFFIDITLIIALLHLIMILMSDFPSV
ncbi:hypothetical protein [Fusobacterium polymorphum]|uniref:Uncharacterized protein n=1 Tax=Fusobacterium nucleatum subsp. polymorphum TaxID=76857 RepID=A0A2C6AZM2_FUSNP|nr:hypothetical protein [Fusobacterium polymorphum]PHH99685.1 hypothetical protein CA836_08455 [Fusobacterium polymorphum]PIM75486.1 hypothetical protein CTM65_05485 [Fusobacterium polymorphum]